MEIHQWSIGNLSCCIFWWERCPWFSVRPSFHLKKTSSHLIFSVESSPKSGKAFTQTQKDWRDGTYDNFKDWAVKQFGIEDADSDDEVQIPVHMQKAKHIEFARNEDGYLILPLKADFKTNKQKQRVIRGYVGAVYSQYFNKYLIFFSIVGQGILQEIRGLASLTVWHLNKAKKLYLLHPSPRDLPWPIRTTWRLPRSTLCTTTGTNGRPKAYHLWSSSTPALSILL